MIFRLASASRSFGFASLSLAVATFGFGNVRITEYLMVGDIFFSLGIVASIFIALHKTKVRFSPIWIRTGTAILVLQILFGSFFVSDMVYEQINGIKFIISIFILPSVMCLLVDGKEERLVIIVEMMVIGAVLNALISVLQVLQIVPLTIGFSGEEWINRYSGFSPHPNHLGLHCAFAVPFVYLRCYRRSDLLGKEVFVIFISLLVSGIFLSGSRAAIVAFIMTIMVVSFFTSKKNFLNIILISISLYAFSQFISLSEVFSLVKTEKETNLFYGISRFVGASQDTEESDAMRKASTAQAIQDWSQSPLLGQGYSSIREAHNIYLQVMAAGGIIGLFGFLYILFGSVRSGLILYKKAGSHSVLGKISLCATAGMLAYMTWGMVQNAIYDRFIYSILGIVAACESVFRAARHSE